VATKECAIIIEKLASGGFRASATQWPDCTAVAPTEHEARQSVEEAIAHLSRRLAEKTCDPSK
jgi:predicted RNase H-like HicB family nuclease